MQTSVRYSTHISTHTRVVFLPSSIIQHSTHNLQLYLTNLPPGQSKSGWIGLGRAGPKLGVLSTKPSGYPPTCRFNPTPHLRATFCTEDHMTVFMHYILLINLNSSLLLLHGTSFVSQVSFHFPSFLLSVDSSLSSCVEFFD